MLYVNIVLFTLQVRNQTPTGRQFITQGEDFQAPGRVAERGEGGVCVCVCVCLCVCVCPNDCWLSIEGNTEGN